MTIGPRPRMEHRKPAPLSPEDAQGALRLLAVAMDAVGQAAQLLTCNDLAADVLGEVTDRLELARIHAAVEAEIAKETTRRNA